MLVKVKVRVPCAYADGTLWVQSQDLPVRTPFDREPPQRTDIRAADEEGRLYVIHGAWAEGEPGILHADAVDHAATVPKLPGGRVPWDEIAEALNR